MGTFTPEGRSAITKILISGFPLAAAYERMLEEVVVDQDVHVPDMATLRFRDSERRLADGGIAIGDRLEVKAGGQGERPTEQIFCGEVTAIEGSYDQTGSFVVVRGYDLEHRLHRGRRTQTYHNVKDSDLVRRVAREVGLEPGKVTDSRIVYDHVSRTNQSGYDFLRSRAGEIGFELDVDDGKLNFRPDRRKTRPVSELELGINLESFYPRISAAEQVSEVEVRSWDPAVKKPIVKRTGASTDSVSVKDNGAAVARDFPTEVLVEVGRPLATSAEVDAVSTAVADQIACAFAQADGVAIGNPRLRAGAVVDVVKTGRQFDGQYTLTSCRHRFFGARYRTSFVVSGQHHRSLLGLASMGETNRLLDRPRINGVVIGQVSDVADPEDLGRVKLQLPWLADDYESTWARLAQMGAGAERGALFIPEVGDEVLVAFEHGDVRSPYVIGGLYNGVDKVGAIGAVHSDGSVNHRSITSRVGHQLVFCDERGAEEIVVQTGDNQVSLTLSQAKTSVTIFSGGEIRIQADSDIEIDGGANLTLKAARNIEIDAGQKLTMAGKTGIDMDSPAQTAITGTPVKLN